MNLLLLAFLKYNNLFKPVSLYDSTVTILLEMLDMQTRDKIAVFEFIDLFYNFFLKNLRINFHYLPISEMNIIFADV